MDALPPFTMPALAWPSMCAAMAAIPAYQAFLLSPAETIRRPVRFHPGQRERGYTFHA